MIYGCWCLAPSGVPNRLWQQLNCHKVRVEDRAEWEAPFKVLEASSCDKDLIWYVSIARSSPTEVRAKTEAQRHTSSLLTNRQTLLQAQLGTTQVALHILVIYFASNRETSLMKSQASTLQLVPEIYTQ